MENFILVENPLIKRDITILRDKSTSSEQFRSALRRVSYSLAVNISEKFDLDEVEIETPLEKTKGYKLKNDIVLVPVLRAGLSMVDAFLEMIPAAKVGHIGLERDEVTLKPKDYYYKTPDGLEKSKVILLDPMLATGGSAVAAFDSLIKRGASDCIIACLISAPEGVKKMNEHHPDIPVFSAALDRQLSDIGYILPGLGDAGDRTFGTL